MEQILKYFPELTARQREQFEALGPLYAEWNARINVVSRREMEGGTGGAGGEFYVRHVLHSLALALALARVRGFGVSGRVCGFEDGERVLDVGTGGGFPAVPLAILFPGASFTAVDSIGKKIGVVEAVARAIGLDNLEAVCARVESLPGRWDWAVSRAVAPADKLLGWVWPRVSEGVMLLKGGDLDAEMAATRRPFTEHNIADWFDEEFFETKKVIILGK